MTNDQKTPAEISEDDLDGVQGAGAKGIVMHEEQETVFMDRKSPGKGVILSSEGAEPSKGIVLSSETENPYFRKR